MALRPPTFSGGCWGMAWALLGSGVRSMTDGQDRPHSYLFLAWYPRLIISLVSYRGSSKHPHILLCGNWFSPVVEAPGPVFSIISCFEPPPTPGRPHCPILKRRKLSCLGSEARKGQSGAQPWASAGLSLTPSEFRVLRCDPGVTPVLAEMVGFSPVSWDELPD